MSNTINDLRKALFETLEGVKNGSIDIDRAKAITDVGQTIINTAKVEVDYIRASGGPIQSAFIDPNVALPTSVSGAPVVTRVHRLKG